MRRWLAGVVVAAGLVLVPAAAAVAVPAGVAAAEAPGPIRDELKIPESDANGDVPILSKVLEEVCPAIDPPTPVAPVVGALAASNGEGGLIDDGPRSGLSGQYGAAGLRWTTYDQACISGARLDTDTGAGFNEVATQFDTMVNEAQRFALDADTTIPFDPVMRQASVAIRDALFSPWLLVALAAVGFSVCLLALTQSGTAALSALIAAILAMGAVMFVAAEPTRIPNAVDRLTTEVSASTAGALVSATGGSSWDGVDPEFATREAYYRGTSYQAWLSGMFCGDREAEAEYGPRFLDAQAFTVAEWNRVKNDPAAQRALVIRKQQAWLDLAQELQTDRPSAFACWAGESGGRNAAAWKHVVATVFVGVPVFVTSMTVYVLRWMLRVAVPLVIALGFLLVASRKVSAAFVEILLVAAVGPPVMAAVSGTVLFLVTIIIRDTSVTWWQSLLSVAGMSLAFWFLRKPLLRALQGGAELSSVGRGMKRGANRLVHRGTGPWSSGGGAGAGALAGAATGAAAAAVLADDNGGDGRRADADDVPDVDDNLPFNVSEGGNAPTVQDSPRPRPAPRPVGRDEWSRFGDKPPVFSDPSDPLDAEFAGFQGGGIPEAVRDAPRLNKDNSNDQEVTVGAREDGDRMMDRQANRLRAYQAAAAARGEFPTRPSTQGDGGPVPAREGRYVPPPVGGEG